MVPAQQSFRKVQDALHLVMSYVHRTEAWTLATMPGPGKRSASTEDQSCTILVVTLHSGSASAGVAQLVER